MTIIPAMVNPASLALYLLLKTLKTHSTDTLITDHRQGDEADLVRGVDTHDWSGHEAHCASHLVAVLVQLVKCLISRLHQVHTHAINLQRGNYQIRSDSLCSMFLWHPTAHGESRSAAPECLSDVTTMRLRSW